MIFEVTILGSASAIPTRNRFPSAQLVHLPGRLFLIDCGEGTQIQLIKEGVGLQKIDRIFISHMHGDHFYGLPGLLSSMHLSGRTQPLWIYADSNLEPLVMPLVQHSHQAFGFDIHFIVLNSNQPKTIYDDDQLRIIAFPLKHGVDTHGFMFQEKPKLRNIDKTFVEQFQPSIADIRAIKQGHDYVDNTGRVFNNQTITKEPPPPRAYAYCSDTAYFNKLPEYIQPATTLYHEASYLQKDVALAHQRNHSTVKEAATVAAHAAVKKLIIGHFSARYNNTADIFKEATEIFPHTFIAEDLMKIEIE